MEITKSPSSGRQKEEWQKVKDSLEAAGYTIMDSNEPELFMPVEGEYGYLLENCSWGHFDSEEDE